MNRTKKKVYGTVLGVAVVAVLVDRLLIGDPVPASAVAIQSQGGGAGAPAERARPSKSLEMPESFPKDLPPVNWARPGRIPFALPDSIAARRFQRLSGQVQAPGRPARRPGEPLTVARFLAAHRLNGIFVGASARAIVDGHTVEVGKKLDASVLLRVHGNRAYFKCQDGVAVLLLDSP